ncbi:hypothetical protein [Echinicola sp. 20G]|uniref:hypothetical protein n=1 Tax=Echinicola sp. 20G TaxID=2781961 RepID=UPI001F1CDC4E|nr:hypothetical protein [Echinicola sp. 20G]
MLFNDFYLKYEFSNFLTGILSDIAGLFLFPYFLSSLLVKWNKSIYLGTAVLFIFWKSHFSQDLINWAQSLGIGFNRVIDFTDLFALIILPISYRYFQKQLSTEQKINKHLTVPLGLATLFSIWATALPREKVDLNLVVNAEYEMELSKADIFNSIQAGHGYSYTLDKNLSDSLFYLHFDIIDESRINIMALSTIIATDTNKTKIKLNKILYGYITGKLFGGVDRDDIKHCKSVSAEEFKNHFELNFIHSIENGKTENIYYDNKEIYDSYQKK